MRNLLVTLLILAFTNSCGPMEASAAPSLDPSKTLVLNQVVTRATLAPLARFLIEGIAKNNLPARITLVIDSPGGSVFAGFQFISLMHAANQKGTSFDCIVPSLAASMAFHILTQCDTRTVLDKSILLWHRARTNVGGMGGEAVTSVMAHDLMVALNAIDEEILQDLNDTVGMHMDSGELKYHFEKETAHLGSRLCRTLASGFCTTKRAVPGLIELLVSNKGIRAAEEMNIFGVINDRFQYINGEFSATSWTKEME